MAYVLYEVAPEAYQFLVLGIALLQLTDEFFSFFLFVRIVFQLPMDGEIRQKQQNDCSRYGGGGHSQIKAAVKVNSERLLFNWQLGRDLVMRKAEERWGTGIVEQVSLDLQTEFPQAEGFSTSNLWYMKRWYLFYSTKLQQLVEELHLSEKQGIEKLQQLVGVFLPDDQLLQTGQKVYDDACLANGFPFPECFGFVPWGQHIEIISRCNDIKEAAFYIRQTIFEGLSRSALANSIKADLFHKQGNIASNFPDTLPVPQARMAQEMMKENYDFGFISLPKQYDEQQLEDALSQHLTRFLLELGTGFAFLGRQKEIVVAGKRRRIDMLFYHIKLRAYIVCELKAVAFEPEFAGKLNFYVSAVDELLKSKDDNPTIGLLICSDLNKTEVKWAFRNIATPLGVATYSNVQIEELQKQLPTEEQLVNELEQTRISTKGDNHEQDR